MALNRWIPPSPSIISSPPQQRASTHCPGADINRRLCQCNIWPFKDLSRACIWNEFILFILKELIFKTEFQYIMDGVSLWLSRSKSQVVIVMMWLLDDFSNESWIDLRSWFLFGECWCGNGKRPPGYIFLLSWCLFSMQDQLRLCPPHQCDEPPCRRPLQRWTHTHPSGQTHWWGLTKD